jgi:hypothetical protein
MHTKFGDLQASLLPEATMYMLHCTPFHQPHEQHDIVTGQLCLLPCFVCAFGTCCFPNLQGVEAVLHVLHDCYGYSYPGGLFLAAVDLMLEKETAVQPVLELLQAIAGATAGTDRQWCSWRARGDMCLSDMRVLPLDNALQMVQSQPLW